MRSVKDYQAKAAAARALADKASASMASADEVANHYRNIAAHWEMLANERYSMLEWKRSLDSQTRA